MKDWPPGHVAGRLQDGDEEEIASLLRTMGPLDRVPDDELPPIKAEAHAAWRRQVRRTAMRRRAAYTALAIAATVIVAVTATLLRSRALPPESTVVAATLETVVGHATVGDRDPAATVTDVMSGTTITTGDAGRTALRLAAGHSVRIDVASTVRIVSGGSLQLERGAVYVDTGAATGDGSAIEIETPFGRVTDLGTRFEVRLIRGDESGDGSGGDAGAVPTGLRVAVREGRVKLATEFGDHEAAAGSELSFYAGGRLDRATTLPYGSSWRWVESVRPPVEVEGVRLTAFLDWAARESGRRWRFTGGDGHDYQDVVLSGSIDGMTVEEALSTMLLSAGLRHRVEGDELLIDDDDGG
jgi:hypothetical protein